MLHCSENACSKNLGVDAFSNAEIPCSGVLSASSEDTVLLAFLLAFFFARLDALLNLSPKGGSYAVGIVRESKFLDGLGEIISSDEKKRIAWWEEIN